MAMSVISSILPSWPTWAVEVLLTMTAVLVCVLILTSFWFPGSQSSSSFDNHAQTEADKKMLVEFRIFRRKYILVYLVVMLADWMQGTHMYTLYLSYNVNISALFLTGFLSGAVFAVGVGVFVDKFGRKRSCIVYCILEIIINCLEHSTNFKILLLGRVLGGISTNLLFSSFESWMTTEHRKRGFPEQWLSQTYSEASVGNGTMAILAGIMAQVLEDSLGHIGPFQGAVALTVAALLLVIPWEENFGEDKDGEHDERSLTKQFLDGWKTTITDSRIWRIGLTQAASEGAMYTFVFMWVPTLLELDPPGGVPTGCIFSAMMMAITVGGLVYSPVQKFAAKFTKQDHLAPELCASIIYLLAAGSMVVPATQLADPNSTADLAGVLASFMVVEFCVGAFMPAAGTIRSKYIPDSKQGAILNIFRLPLNAVVVMGTHASDVMSSSNVYRLVCGLFFTAFLFQASFLSSTRPPTKEKAS